MTTPAYQRLLRERAMLVDRAVMITKMLSMQSGEVRRWCRHCYNQPCKTPVTQYECGCDRVVHREKK